MIGCRQFQEWLDENPGWELAELTFMATSGEYASSNSPVELQAIREHVEQCPACAMDCRERLDAWLLLPSSLDSLPVPSSLEAEVMRRIAETTLPRNANLQPHSHDHLIARRTLFMKPEVWRYVVAAAVLAAMVSYVMLGPVGSNRSGVPAAEELVGIKELARQMDRLDELQQVFASPGLRFVSLQSTTAATTPRGYIVYDLSSQEAHFFGLDLETTALQEYRLSLLDEAGRTVSSAKISVDANTRLGSAIVQLPAVPQVLRQAIVTLEIPSEQGAVDSHSDDIVMQTEIAL